MRIYSYGARSPFEGGRNRETKEEGLIHQQLRLAQSYQNKLVEIERARRAAIDQLYIDAAPAEHQAFRTTEEAAIKAAQAVKLSRSTGGEMLAPDEDTERERREALKAAKEALEAARGSQNIARQAWQDARRKATPGLKERLKACDAATYASKRVAYGEFGTLGLGWGTRLKVDQAVELSARMAQKEHSLPKFFAFDGSGSLAVQLQGGLSVSDALAATDTQLRIEIVDAGIWQMVQGKSAFSRTSKAGNVISLPQPGAYQSVKRDGTIVNLPRPKADSKRSQKSVEKVLAIVRIRLGSNGRTPIWGAWPVVLHRPLPPDALIKWAQMVKKKVGPRHEWSLCITLDDTQPALRSVERTLAVNLGWRKVFADETVRVAYAVGSDGFEQEVKLPPAFLRGMAHVDELQQIRKKNFNRAKGHLADWLHDDLEGMPLPAPWMVEEARRIDDWLSPKRIVRFMRRWRESRLSGDDALWIYFETWQKQDKHLWFWESDERAKLLRFRKDTYRVVAASWAERYQRILVTDMDLRDFAELPAPEEGAATKDKAQRITQRFAAPSELRAAIVNAASTRGAKVEEIKKVAKYAGPTITCHACGVVVRFDARRELQHTCRECGATWDQDRNHCLVLLAGVRASGEVVRDPAGPLAPTADTPENGSAEGRSGRWAKRRSKKAVQVPGASV